MGAHGQSLGSQGRISSQLDDDFSVPDKGSIGLHRNGAGRQHDLAGADVELSLVKIALDNIALDDAFRQRAGTMGAMIVGDVEFAADIENRKLEILYLDLDHAADSDVGGTAQLELRCAG